MPETEREIVVQLLASEIPEAIIQEKRAAGIPRKVLCAAVYDMIHEGEERVCSGAELKQRGQIDIGARLISRGTWLKRRGESLLHHHIFIT